MTRARIEHWDDIRYSAEFKFFKDDPESHVVNVRVWKSDPQGDGTRIFVVNCEVFDNHEDAEPAHTAFIKWDGCADFDISIHFCNPSGIRRFCTMVERVYQTAGEMLAKAGTVDGDCFTDMSGN